MRPEKAERRPHQGTGAQDVARVHAIVPMPTDTLVDLDALAAHVDGAFVLVVKVTGEDVKYRRRCFLTAASAERAARRATERGENATVYLAELKPLWRVIGGAA